MAPANVDYVTSKPANQDDRRKRDNVKVINFRETFPETVTVGHAHDSGRAAEQFGEWTAGSQVNDDMRAPRGLAQGLVLGLSCWGIVGLLIWIL